MRPSGGTRLVALLFGVMASAPSFASHWIPVGIPPGHPDGRIVVDVDSLQKFDQFTLVDIMTIYATPLVNSHDITLDRFVQRTAINCATRTFARVTTTGYLGTKQVGASSESADWRISQALLPNDATSNQIYDLVCKPAAPTPNAKVK